MNDLLYDMIFKRKSFHVFKTEYELLPNELEEVKRLFEQVIPLISNIKVKIKLVPNSETTSKRGEYCILLYSEQKEIYLRNIGYIGAQLDLLLASFNIGVCWYGVGKVKRQIDEGLEFTIMLTIQKVSEGEFRKNMFLSKRKPLIEIWKGETYDNVSEIVRFAPSACNLQPWFISSDNKQLKVYKQTQTKRGIMPKDKVDYYSEIDMGIFLCYLEICLTHAGIAFTKELYDLSDISNQRQLCAIYNIL